MQVYHTAVRSIGDTALALGGFDGLHIGHREVILAAGKEGKGLVPSVFTFQGDLYREGKQVPRIMTQRRKIQLLDEMGVQQCWVMAFSEIRDMEAEVFLREILLDTCRAKMVCCGEDFRFGKGGKGTSELLKTFCSENGIEARVLPIVTREGAPVSSTRIREALTKGNVKEAEALLGRPFEFDTPVIHGRQLGRTLGTPTLNQPIPEDFILPKFGVYAARVRIGERTFFGVTNVGVKPTVGGKVPLAETWMPEYEGGFLYGESLITELIEFIRPEEKFAGVEELRKQILKDAETAKKIIYKL